MKKPIVISLLCIIGLVSILCGCLPLSLAQNPPASKDVSSAEAKLSEAYDESIRASRVGVSLAVLQSRLTDAANLLEQAYYSLQSGDLENAGLLANESMRISGEVEQEARVLKQQAETVLAENLKLTLVLTGVGLGTLLAFGLLGWVFLRRDYFKTNENDRLYGSARHPLAKTVYFLLCVSLAVAILAPSLIMLFPQPDGQQFSEFWLLGHGHSAQDYPSNVSVGSTYKVYLDVQSHWRYLAYYSINIRLENTTTPLGNMSSQASDQPLMKFKLFLEQNTKWEKDVDFSFENVSFTGNSSLVSGFTINGRKITVDKSSSFDEGTSAYRYRLIFELWTYNFAESMLEYNEYLGIMLTLSPTG
jgi:hypothetical protein